METVNAEIAIDSALNEETRKAIEDVGRGIGLTKAYHSAAELFAALDKEEERLSYLSGTGTHSDIFPSYD